MTAPRRGASARPPRKARILVFGENDHDRRALKTLIEGLRPELAGRVGTRRAPLYLVKGRSDEATRSEAQRVADVVQAEQPVCALFVHEDCDDVEPAHQALASTKKTALEAAVGDPDCRVVAVTPAWEIEAWWFLWPDAVKAANPSWRAPIDYAGRNVGMIRNAKEVLNHCIQPRGKKAKRVRDYEEADSPDIAAKTVEMGLLDSHREARTTSGSFEAFHDGVHMVEPSPEPAAAQTRGLLKKASRA